MTQPKREAPKLPAKQLAILAVARFAEPLALTSVFPYLPEMIKSFGVEKDQVAKWAGVTSAVFSFSQSLTAVPWGRLSDSIGRKWTIIMGLCSTMICFLVWGMSTSLTMAITVRAIQGASNGNVGIIRTMVAELVPERELQPRAFSIMPLVWSIGSIFGPSFGGFFAKPADRFPFFANIAFFRNYPFALPNMVGAVFFLVSLTTATLFLRETLEGRRGHEDWGLAWGKRLTRPFKRGARHRRPRRRSFVDGEATAPLLPARPGARHLCEAPPQPRPTTREVFTTQTVINLTAYTFLALHSVAYDQVLPVFLNYPVQHHTPANTHLPFGFSGGFGLGSDRIGTIFTIYGIACGLIQFIVFPPLCTWYGVHNCYKTCAVLFPIVYIVTPYTVLIEDTTRRYAALMCILLVKSFSVIIGFPCMTILLTNSAISVRILGTLNGFATAFSGLGRAVGPALTGATFTWGVGRGSVVPAWWLLALVAAIGAIPAWLIVEGDGPSGSSAGTSIVGEEDDNDDEDDEEERQTAAEEDDDGDDENMEEDDDKAGGAPDYDAAVFESDEDEDGSVDDPRARERGETSPLLASDETSERRYNAVASGSERRRRS